MRGPILGQFPGPERGRVLYDGLDVQPPPEPASRAEMRRELAIAADAPVI